MADLKYQDGLHYAKSDEWLKLDGDVATLGISDYAQDQLNDVVYVDLPEVGTKFSAGDSFGEVESVKAVSDVYTPVAGEVIEVNSKLEDTPELINSDPYGEGWIVKLKLDSTDLPGDLMDVEAYKQYNASRD
jgi:glycine cleavage system H protein